MKLSRTSADNSHNSSLGLTDVVEQRTVGRTRKLARATLDTADNLFLLGTLPVLDSGKLSQQIGFQTHRTGADALGTADAGLWLLAESLLIRDNRH